MKKQTELNKELIYSNSETLKVVAKCLKAGVTIDEIQQLIFPSLGDALYSLNKCPGDKLKTLEYVVENTMIKNDENGMGWSDDCEAWDDVASTINELKIRIDKYEENKETKQIMERLGVNN